MLTFCLQTLSGAILPVYTLKLLKSPVLLLNKSGVFIYILAQEVDNRTIPIILVSQNKTSD